VPFPAPTLLTSVVADGPIGDGREIKSRDFTCRYASSESLMVPSFAILSSRAAEFDTIGSPSKRVGPKGRKLFEQFLRKVNKLGAQQQLEAQAQGDSERSGERGPGCQPALQRSGTGTWTGGSVDGLGALAVLAAPPRI
jgi:hypothetical protein